MESLLKAFFFLTRKITVDRFFLTATETAMRLPVSPSTPELAPHKPGAAPIRRKRHRRKAFTPPPSPTNDALPCRGADLNLRSRPEPTITKSNNVDAKDTHCQDREAKEDVPTLLINFPDRSGNRIGIYIPRLGAEEGGKTLFTILDNAGMTMKPISPDEPQLVVITTEQDEVLGVCSMLMLVTCFDPSNFFDLVAETVEREGRD